MAKFNLGNYLQDNVFSKNEFKQITTGIANIGGRFVNFGSTILDIEFVTSLNSRFENTLSLR